MKKTSNHKVKKCYLDNINSPGDLKKLNLRELTCLSSEIRNFLLHSVAETGGHLASNLGVVELTIALHYCYNMPCDKIIWDVGHQAYTHKILTGRKGRFNTLRKLNGLSGFPAPPESIYDSFGAGHSSTSVSAALGMAEARDLAGGSYDVVAVIGDGSMTGGLAYEAMNNAGQSEKNMLVVLNDNQMSISENVGALSRHLNEIRTAPAYIGAKRDIHKFLDKTPYVGKPASIFIERIKNGIKYFFVSGVLFEELGFTYIGPVNGHNLGELIRVIKKCKKIEGPVLLHTYTQKGKGYLKAENSPEKYHGVDSFDLRTGNSNHKKRVATYSEVFGNKLVSIASKNEKIVAISASMISGTGLSEFALKFPERIFDVGIAEAHAVTFCAGLAKSGLIPVFAVYSSFLQRAYDQILHDVCIQKLPVIFAIDRAGIVGADGKTHQGIFDLSYLLHLPDITLLAPKNTAELEKMLEYAVSLNAPVALRYPKGGDSCSGETSCSGILPIEHGMYEIVKHGGEAAVMAVGTMFETAYSVYNMLKENGVNASLINARFVKPLSEGALKGLKKYKYIFTIEDNVLTGGFGSYLLQELNRSGFEGKIHCFALPDKFIEHGSRSELFNIYGLDKDSIFKHIITKIRQCAKFVDLKK